MNPFESLRKIPKFCAFPQNFHTRELGEITVFYAMNVDRQIA